MSAVAPRPILALVFGLAALSGCASAVRAHQAAASPAEIRAYLAAAKRGSVGRFTLTYDTTVAYGRGVVHRVVVSVAQRSADFFSYRTTPSLDLSRPGGAPASYSYEVFAKPGANTTPGAGIYSCRKRLASLRWSCEGPYTQIGMGGMEMLLGPYPPQALVLGLDNAAAVYRYGPAVAPVRPQPAFLITRRVSGFMLRCLEFGPIRTPVGRVCIRPTGLITSYELSGTVTSGFYETATLRSYSPRVSPGALELPANAHQPQLAATAP